MAKPIQYTDQFRQKAVDLYQKNNYSAAQIARKLGVHEHTMCRWIKLYGKDKIVSSQSAVEQAILHAGHCARQDFDCKHPHALEQIDAIKQHVDALEQLLL